MEKKLAMERREEEKRLKELEERKRQQRYKTRKNIDELVQPILSLEIINSYYFTQDEFNDAKKRAFFDNRDLFPLLPHKFEKAVEYQEKWIKLNLYETFNQLINQKNESEKDAELARLYGMRVRNDNSKKSFKGFIQNDTTRNKLDIDHNIPEIHRQHD